MRLTLKSKLILLCVAMVAVPLTANTILNAVLSTSQSEHLNQYLKDAMVKEAKARLSTILENDHALVSNLVQQTENDAQRLAASSNLQGYLSAETGTNETLRNLGKERVFAEIGRFFDLLEARRRSVEQKLTRDLKLARAVMKQYGMAVTAGIEYRWKAKNELTGEAQSIKLPLIQFGQKLLYPVDSLDQEVAVIDDVKAISGSDCIIFQRMNEAGDMLRVGSSVVKGEKMRHVGTFVPAKGAQGDPNPFIQAVLQGQTYHAREKRDGEWVQSLYAPLVDPFEQVMGAVAVTIREKDVEGIQKAIASAHLGTSGIFFIVDGQGVIVAHPDSEQVGKKVGDLPDASQILAAYSKAREVGKAFISFKGGDGVPRVMAGIEYVDYGWVIMATCSWEDLAGEAQKAYWRGFRGEMEALWKLGVVHTAQGERPLYSQVRYLDAKGREVLKFVDGAFVHDLENKSATSWFQEAGKADGPVNTGVVLAEYTGRPEMRVVMPLREKDQFMGAVVVNLDWAVVWEVLSSKTYGKTGYSYVVNPEGILISHPKYTLTDGIALTDARYGVLGELMKKGLGGEKGTGAYEFEGVAKFVAYKPLRVGDATYVVATTMAQDELMETARHAARQLGEGQWQSMKWALGIALVMLAVGGGVAVAFGRRTAAPIVQVVEGLSEGADQVAGASEQVSESSQELADGASQQAASLEETSSALEEMAAMTRQNADNASQADAITKATGENLVEAQKAMETLEEAMGDIGEASQETQKIIKTIDEIAFQTNLLALNAAVEAARAGEAGAGFAVVADEVRNLAMRAAEAAKNTSEIIDRTVQKVGFGNEASEQVSKAFAKVAEGSARIGELVSEIAAASSEQAEGIEQINRAVADMDRVVQQNAANAEESASASEELRAQAQQVREYVQQLAQVVGSRQAHSEDAPALPHHSEMKRLKGGAQKPKEVSPPALPQRRLQSAARSIAPTAHKQGKPAPGPSAGKDVMVWTDEYSVGDFDLDRQHKRLFALVNQLAHAMRQGQGKKVLEPIVGELVDYTQTHFEDEERAMERCGYPDLAAHRETHAKFVQKVQEVVDKFQKGEVGLSFEVLEFLETWLKKHILGTDCQYAPHLSGGREDASDLF
ncbi:hemerythrin-like metal-binding domain protein [Desulfacinum hydrothermale DSM 13146]|uniref:Hemerythrin-like metal-binding domain protein n=1 Tax=Desulfacinum hydrothermale DSM 13146 TaxID=1121390 RepID=A0A1W1XHH6_9BACT|nr:bacteriohemerythrin [Desulfacinum hydrothermale]SMC22961.1 hemerythrin-like metal-binding domain protein [Desulfacinum hydrothermale DSM 13146]